MVLFATKSVNHINAFDFIDLIFHLLVHGLCEKHRIALLLVTLNDFKSLTCLTRITPTVSHIIKFNYIKQ